MKNLFFTFSAFLISGLALAQEFQGMAVYESKTSSSDMSARFQGNRDITPEMQKRIEERMKKMLEKTFTLNFDKNASIYKEEEKLETPGTSNGNMRMMGSFMGGGGTHYKNVKEKVYVIDKEMFGKEFLVKDTLETIKWNLTQETKQIGDYLCFKATAKVKNPASDFRNFRMREESKETKVKTDEEKKTTNMLPEGEVPKELEVVAWYTPDVPVNNGPENFQGLPGLILEVIKGRTTILCSKVVMNVKDKKELKAPTNGKVVTQNEYDEIMKKKMEEMREMFQSRGGNGGMQIRMGN
jgi:GLPGLI family protein